LGRTLRAVPAWGWLAVIVLLSFALRAWLARGMVAPFVMVDELIYTELARSLAADGEMLVRGVPASGYSVLYPLAISPAYAIFDDLVDAYGAAKTINALLMSLSAIPAYLLARRVASEWLSLLGAVLAVALPSLAYTGTLTTESVFYPAALVVALLLVRYLQRPGWGRLAALAAGLGAAYLTRSQALGFVPVVATAPPLLALLRRDARVLRPFVPLYALLAAGAVAVVALQQVRGEPLRELLGAYAVVGESGYDVDSVARFWLWHVEELTLYVGIIPLAVLILLLGLSRTMPPALQEHVALTTASVFWGTLVVGAFASRFASDRIQDRYLFYLAPLLLVCVLGWIAVGAPRPLALAVPAALLALALPLVFPYTRFVGEPAKSDTLGLIPLWTYNDRLPFDSYWAAVALVGAALVVLFLLVDSRTAIAVPLALLALYAVESRPVWSGANGFLRASEGALFQGIQGQPRNWIDAAVPDGGEVAVLWTGRADRFTVNQNEFFNRDVGDVLYTQAPTPGGLGEQKVSIDSRGGIVRDEQGRPVRVPYVLADGTVAPDGEVVVRDDPLGTTVWRVNGDLVSTTTTDGLYDDGWSEPELTWTRHRCRGGTLAVTVSSDPSLFRTAQTVTAYHPRGTVSGRAEVEPKGTATIEIPLHPSSDECIVRFAVSPTAVPAQEMPGSTDDRRLGARFAFAYTPPE
jgi:hypothetical protein